MFKKLFKKNNTNENIINQLLSLLERQNEIIENLQKNRKETIDLETKTNILNCLKHIIELSKSQKNRDFLYKKIQDFEYRNINDVSLEELLNIFNINPFQELKKDDNISVIDNSVQNDYKNFVNKLPLNTKNINPLKFYNDNGIPIGIWDSNNVEHLEIRFKGNNKISTHIIDGKSLINREYSIDEIPSNILEMFT